MRYTYNYICCINSQTMYSFKKSIQLTALFVFIMSISSFGQSCNCNQELNFVKDKIENNYAGFTDKVNSRSKTSYDQHTLSFLKKTQSVTNPSHCVYLINEWLSFFKDGHILVGRNRISKEKEEAELMERIKNIELISLSNDKISLLSGNKGIEGVYINEDSGERIAFIKSKTEFRDYAGIIISSVGKWSPGQVCMELKMNKDTLEGIVYDKYFIPNNVKFPIKKDSFGTYLREGIKQAKNEKTSEATVSSEILSAKTLYLKINTFNQNNAKKIDSLFKANQSNLAQMPNLILDLRNNGGGADFSYRPVTPYLYTEPIRNIGSDVLATADNITGWAAVATTDGIPPDQKNFMNGVIKKMEQNKGKFISFSEDSTISFDSILPNPKTVVILINKNCGSTTEEFLLLAKQSSKVTLMGEPTAGVLDYANVRGADFSCMPYMLYWATTRSKRIDQGMGIDNVGIMPDKKLKPEEDWINEAKRFVEK